MRRTIVIGLLAALLIGCAAAVPTPDQPAVTPTSMTTSETQPELAQYFDGQPGTFVLYDLKHDHTLRYDPDRAAQRFLPASTFKILNSLISLESGVIPDENTIIKWDGTVYDIPQWNHDQTMRSAIKDSVVC